MMQVGGWLAFVVALVVPWLGAFPLPRLLYFGIALYRSSVRAQALAHEAGLAALRYQIQPHFLFNALNALSTLIVERRNEKASRMVAQLAGFFRVTLEGTGTEIPLHEEIEFARRYLELE